MAKNQSTEDYIKGIYKLRKNGKGVSTSELARHLNISDASVTDMIKRLSARKLLHYVPYRGVDLTEAGKKLAVKMMRRHRLWEMFLVQFLGYSWDEVHEEAEHLEHVTSDELERRLDKLLAYPKVDPHGDPIPSAKGEMDTHTYSMLAEFDNGDHVVIIRVSDNPTILQHATKLGLTLGVNVLIREKVLFDGSMKVRVGKKDQFISKQLAEAIFVKTIK